VARLGFQNYAEFQAAVQEEVAAQLQSPASRASAAARPASGVSPMVEATLDNIRETFHYFSARQIDDVVGLIAGRHATILLVGGRFTDPLARYMAAHLAIIRPNVFHLAGQEGNWHDRLVDLGKRDVLLVFDIRRYQDSLLRFAARANQRGVQIVLFTDQWLSPIAKLARHVVVGRTAVPSPWDSSASLMVIAETIIAGVTEAREADAARRIRDLDSLR
jgi:DNA-binding MurR/RpiR family transcriptional regulator